jgi:hypothetical protein
MMISKFIVETIYSMEPPGRFLKKCSETGEWRELSKKEAADKAAQAMAYAVRAELKAKQKIEHSHLLRLYGDTGVEFSQPEDQPPLPSYVNAHNASNASAPTAYASAASGGGELGTNAAASAKYGGDTVTGGSHELRLQQELLYLQYASTTTQPTASISGARLGFAQMLSSQEQILQQQYHLHRQQQLYHRYLLMGHHALQPHTQLPSTSLPSTQSSSAPGAMLPNLDIQRQEYFLGGNYGTQPSNSSQNQGSVNVNPNAFHSAMGNYTFFGTASATQPESQLLDRLQRAEMQRNHLLLSSSSSLAASNYQPRLQPFDLLHQRALLQPNSSPPPTAEKLE